jgi:anhydro-N-acetylmuramic acid kinase
MVNEILAAAERERIAPADLVATASTLSVEAVAQSLETHILPRQAVDEILLCGGGARNAWITQALGARLAPRPVLTTDDIGFPARAVEATAFALLAYLTYTGQPGNLPAATGAKQAVPLGKMVPGKGYAGMLA